MSPLSFGADMASRLGGSRVADWLRSNPPCRGEQARLPAMAVALSWNRVWRRLTMTMDRVRLSNDPTLWTDRQGTAVLTRLAFTGGDLEPLWKRLVCDLSDDARGAGIG